jgi:hypothetical protein
MRWYAKERAVERVARAAASGLDLLGFWTEARGVLASAIPHHITPCWYTLDPASLLVTGHYDHGMISELPPQWLAHEYAAEDCHKLADVVQGPAALSTLHDATGGDPSRSPRWQRFIEPYGGDQELLLPLRAATREVWGVLALYRAPGQPAFDVEERELLTALAPHLAEGARRGLLVGEAREPEQPEAPGLVVLDEHFEIDSLTPAVERWLRELPGGRAGPNNCRRRSSQSRAARSRRRMSRGRARSPSRAFSRRRVAGSPSTARCSRPVADASP